MDVDLGQFPHCDQRVLHKPGTCQFCDLHPEWQALRERWGIAFTGEPASARGLPCPADHDRPAGSESDHRLWAGNKPTTAEGDASWPRESPASVAVYGDRGGRARRRSFRWPWSW